MLSKKIILLLLSSAMCFAKEFEEGVDYPYSYFSEDVDFHEEVKKPEPNQETSKNKSTYVRQAKVGNIEVTAKVENADSLSQNRAEWEQMKKKRDISKEDKRSSFQKSGDKKKDEEESHSPKAEISFKWSSK